MEIYYQKSPTYGDLGGEGVFVCCGDWRLLLPADGPPRVLLVQPRFQWGEVLEHRPGRDIHRIESDSDRSARHVSGFDDLVINLYRRVDRHWRWLRRTRRAGR